MNNDLPVVEKFRGLRKFSSLFEEGGWCNAISVKPSKSHEQRYIATSTLGKKAE